MSEYNWIGFEKNKRVINLSYDKIGNILSSQMPEQKKYNPDCVIAIARGGIVPATMISTNLSIPLYILSVTRGVNEASWLSKPTEDFLLSSKTALLVDDIVSSGTSIKKAKTFLSQYDIKVVVNSVFYDVSTPEVPEIGLEANDYIKFPWEKKENSLISLQSRKENNNSMEFHFSHEEDYFGFDLDGIFTPDMPDEYYLNDLEYALRLRDNFLLLPSAPKFIKDIEKNTVIITGRPDLDYERTLNWLHNNNYNLPLYCRDHKVYGHSRSEMILSKIKHINDLGITCYFESDVFQSVEIAKSIPTIDVIWWNNGNPVKINAYDYNLFNIDFDNNK